MKRQILVGSTDQTIDIFINDSSSTIGAGLTGLVFNTAGLTCYYRKGATGTPTALTLATQTVGGAHSDGGFVAVDGTNCPGQYRLDLSDTIVAAAGAVTLYLRGATNMAPCLVEIEVVNFSLTGQSATDLKDFADDGYDPSTNKVQGVVLVDTTTTVTNQLTAAAIATGVWQDSTAGDFTAASSIGKSLYTSGVVPGGSGGLLISGSNSGTTTLGAFTVTGATTLTGAVSLGSTLGVTGAITATNASNNITLGTFTVTTNAISWNSAWDAEVQSEVDDALVAQRLDELLNADSDIDGAAPPTVGSVFHELMSKTAGSFTFDQTTDSLEAIRDRGDAAWTTATGFSTHTAADVWSVATRVLTAGTNIALAKGTGVIGFNDLDAAGIRSAVGLAAANLDTQLDALPTAAENFTAVLTTAMTESYAADGAAPTLAQAVFLVQQSLHEFAISGTTRTVKKLDGTTTAATFTLDSSTAPTSTTRAS